MKPLLALCAFVALIIATPLAHADAALQTFLEQTLTAARDKNHLPAVAAVVQIDGKLEAEAALGLRALGHPDAVTINDRWHIGSDTKAFTATLIARLVEQGVMKFDDTLATSFPALAKEMNPAYRTITVTQLLSHTAGLPPIAEDSELPELYAISSAFPDVKDQRAAVARHYLKKPQASKPGEFVYSNLGYIIAGAIAEAHTGKSWEDLVREQIFTPLGIKNAGFGSPGTPGKTDQPWGHEEKAPGTLIAHDPATADMDANTRPVIGPAGTINIALKDWLLFAQDQLDGVHGHGKLLKPETYRKLHTPVTGNYALGWGAKLGATGIPEIITHSGSNGYWLADIRILPKHDMIFLTVTNAGNEAANGLIKDVGTPLKDRLKPLE